MKQSILITGANGFLGKHVVSTLNTGEYQLFCTRHSSEQNFKQVTSDAYLVECDLTNGEHVDTVMRFADPDIVIHLAAKSTPNAPQQEWKNIINDNIAMTTNLANAADKFCKIIHASSVVVYGTTYRAAVENDTRVASNAYAMSKICSENILELYERLNNIRVIDLRFCAMVGEGLTHGVLRDFIRKVKMRTMPFDILGNCPGSDKPYLYVNDAISAILRAMESNLAGAFNIVPDDTLTIDELADIVLKHYKSSKPKKWTGANFVGDNPSLRCCNEIAKKHLGWSPKYTSAQAIKETLKDYDRCFVSNEG